MNFSSLGSHEMTTGMLKDGWIKGVLEDHSKGPWKGALATWCHILQRTTALLKHFWKPHRTLLYFLPTWIYFFWLGIFYSVWRWEKQHVFPTSFQWRELQICMSALKVVSPVFPPRGLTLPGQVHKTFLDLTSHGLSEGPAAHCRFPGIEYFFGIWED